MNNAIQLKAADAFAPAHGYSASVVRLRNTSDVSIDYSVSGGDAVELAAGASAVIDVAALTSEISVRRTDLSTTPVNVMLEFGLDPDEAYVFAVESSTAAAADITLADLGGVPTSRTVNGHALTGDVSVTASDVGLGNVTNAAQVLRSEMGAANGVATLEAGGKVPLSQIPDALIGQVKYQGSWDAATNSPTLSSPPDSTTKGYYYVTSTAGTQFGISFEVGDWIISDGSTWQKVDNTDAVVSVAGRIGAITLTSSDISDFASAAAAAAPVLSVAGRTGVITLTAGDVGLGSVENTALSTWTGSANLATVGTITAGTWHGSAIADTYISSAATWNAKVSFPGFGTTAGTAAEGNDVRLSDARTPLAHTQAWSTITTTPTTLSGYGITDAQGLDADLTALAGLSTTGLVARTGAGTAATRTITGTTNQVIVSNGDGVAGNPTLSLPQDIATNSTPQFAGLEVVSPVEGVIQHVKSPGETRLFVTNTTASVTTQLGSAGEMAYVGTYTNHPFCIRSNDLDRITIDTAGNVGIGTTAPAASLQVAGNVLFGTNANSITNGFKGEFGDPNVGNSGGFRFNKNSTEAGTKVFSSYHANSGIEFCHEVLSKTDARFIFSGGKVGIGTTSPQTLLHVGSGNESSAATNPGALKVHTSGTKLESVGGIELPVATDGYSVKIQGVYDSGAALVFANRAESATWTERMRINAAGKVGIGTSSPAAQLHLRSGSDNIAEVIRLDNPTDESDNGSKIVWRNADISNDAAFFAARRIGASNGIALTFGTAADWSTKAATEKMRIAGNGNVGINNTNPARKLDVVGDDSGNGICVTGTTGTIGALTAEGTTIKLQADSDDATRVIVDASANASGIVELNGGSSGSVQLGTGGTARMQVFASGAVKLNSYGAGTLQTDSSGNVTASSDASLKTVTGSFTRGLADVLKLTPRTYHWNEKSGMNTEDENVGFIAQEVLEAIPEAVGSVKTVDTEEDDGTGKKVKKSKREASEYLTLSDRPLIAALVNAVKELKADNDALRARVSALENGKAAK